MTTIIVLDSPVLGLASNPKVSDENNACNLWLAERIAAGHRIIIPAIVDYEFRRELIRANKVNGLKTLDTFCATLEYLELTRAALTYAATLWAHVRQAGKPTADEKALDGDVILAAQVLQLGVPTEDSVIATTNIGHLSRFVTAKLWRDIP